MQVLKLFMSLTQWASVPQKTNKLLETILEGVGNNTQHVIVLLSKLSSCLLISVSQDRCVRSSRVKATGLLIQSAQGQADHINNISGGCRNLCTTLCFARWRLFPNPAHCCSAEPASCCQLFWFFSPEITNSVGNNLLFSNCWQLIPMYKTHTYTQNLSCLGQHKTGL